MNLKIFYDDFYRLVYYSIFKSKTKGWMDGKSSPKKILTIDFSCKMGHCLLNKRLVDIRVDVRVGFGFIMSYQV